MSNKKSRKDDKWPTKFVLFVDELEDAVLDDCREKSTIGTVFPTSRRSQYASHYRIDMQGVREVVTSRCPKQVANILLEHYHDRWSVPKSPNTT